MNMAIDHPPCVTPTPPRAFPPPWRRAKRAGYAALLPVLLVISGAAGAQELTLDEEEAVRRATSSSHTLEAVRQRVASAAHGIAAADSGRWPVLTAEVLDAHAELAAAEGDGIVVATSARLAAAQLARAVGR